MTVEARPGSLAVQVVRTEQIIALICIAIFIAGGVLFVFASWDQLNETVYLEQFRGDEAPKITRFENPVTWRSTCPGRSPTTPSSGHLPSPVSSS